MIFARHPKINKLQYLGKCQKSLKIMKKVEGAPQYRQSYRKIS